MTMQNIRFVEGSWGKITYGKVGRLLVPQPKDIIEAMRSCLKRMFEDQRPILVGNPKWNKYYRNLIKNELSLEAEPISDYQGENRMLIIRPRFCLGVGFKDGVQVTNSIEEKYVAELLLSAFLQIRQLQKVINFFIKVVAKLEKADLLKKTTQQIESFREENKAKIEERWKQLERILWAPRNEFDKRFAEFREAGIKTLYAGMDKKVSVKGLKEEVQAFIEETKAMEKGDWLSKKNKRVMRGLFDSEKVIAVVFDPEISKFFPLRIASRLKLTA